MRRRRWPLVLASALVVGVAAGTVAGQWTGAATSVAGPLLTAPVGVPLGTGTLLVDTDPRACGTNALHLTVTDPDGAPLALESPAAALEGGGRRRPLRLLPAGPGRFLTVAIPDGDAGTWVLRFSARAAGGEVSASARLTLS